jgi:hypothetical protein
MPKYKITASGKAVENAAKEVGDMFKELFKDLPLQLEEVGISLTINTEKEFSEEDITTFTSILEKEALGLKDLIETKVTVEKL